MNDGDAPAMQARCSGTNRDGAACRAAARPGAAWCLAHDPARVADLAAWRRKGGHGKSNAARARKALAGDARDLVGVMASLLAAMGKVERGELEAGPANALANIARAVVAVAGAADFERRLAELERAAGEQVG